MIERLAELNRLLFAVLDLSDAEKNANIQSVIRNCDSTVTEGKIPNHEETIEFAVKIGFLSKKGKSIKLLPDGQAFVNINKERLYDLSQNQKKVLIKRCYFGELFRKQTFTLFKGFIENPQKNTYVWSGFDNPPLKSEPWMMQHLLELKIIIQNSGLFEVNSEYVSSVTELLTVGKGWSQEEFDNYLLEKKELGNIAEKIILNYERNRLKRLGYTKEAISVQLISGFRVSAGYDLESFDASSKDLAYDRFIEVKGSIGQKVRFFWTKSEMDVAKKLGNKYWIYFQGGIDPKTNSARNEPLLFQNPLVSIMKNENLKHTTDRVKIEGNMQGEPARPIPIAV